MAFDVNSLIIDRALRGTLINPTSKEVIFSISQIKNPALECDGESVYVQDNVGVRIAAFDRSKTATFSAENALFDFGLAAAQFGADKQLSTADNKILVPQFDSITVGATGGTVNTTITLSRTPATGSLTAIYVLNKDKSLGTKYLLNATTADTDEFAYSGTTLTLPTGSGLFTKDSKIAVWYQYEADAIEGNRAVKITNKADTFGKEGMFDLEVLFCDVCTPSVKYYGHVLFDSIKMDSKLSINFSNEMVHNFSFEALSSYCEEGNPLFHIIVPETDD